MRTNLRRNEKEMRTLKKDERLITNDSMKCERIRKWMAKK